MSIYTWLLIYFLMGIVFLGTFDIITHRIRIKFRTATAETQIKLATATTPTFIGERAAAIIFGIALWLFWPAVFVGVITDRKRGKDGTQK